MAVSLFNLIQIMWGKSLCNNFQGAEIYPSFSATSVIGVSDSFIDSSDDFSSTLDSSLFSLVDSSTFSASSFSATSATASSGFSSLLTSSTLSGTAGGASVGTSGAFSSVSLTSFSSSIFSGSSTFDSSLFSSVVSAAGTSSPSFFSASPSFFSSSSFLASFASFFLKKLKLFLKLNFFLKLVVFDSFFFSSTLSAPSSVSLLSPSPFSFSVSSSVTSSLITDSSLGSSF